MIAPATNFFTGAVPAWCPGRVWQDTDGPLMIDIPPGWFTMGGDSGDQSASEAERPAHEVSISPGLAFSKGPITVGEFRRFRDGFLPDEDSELPAVYTSWVDAAEYCAWLSLKTGLPYRLPSEAEWEFACRAGSVAAFTFGDDLTPVMANYRHDGNGENGASDGQGSRTRAGTYPSNVFGLHDVHGNVCEWVADSWHPNYAGAPAEGSAWSGPGELRVLRGGAWNDLPRLLRCSHRDSLPRHCRRDNSGFRVAVSLEIRE